MKPHIPILIILMLLSTSFLGVSFNSEKSFPASFDGNFLYVGGDGPGNYTKIQDALDDANDGDTIYVFDDSSPYNEHLYVEASINLIGENKHTTIIDGGAWTDTVKIFSNWANISGFTITNSGDYDSGIYIKSDYNTINDNIISDTTYGMELYRSDNNRIINNIVSGTELDIDILQSKNNTIIGNSLLNNGIFFWQDQYSNTIFNNTVNDKPLVYLENVSNQVITDAGQLILAKCSDIIVEELTLSNVYSGVALSRSFNCSIRNNTLSKNKYGITLFETYNNNITENHITNCDYAIKSNYGHDNTIKRNSISNNFIGLHLRHYNNHNIIKENNISSSNNTCIQLLSSSSNIITENIISNANCSWNIGMITLSDSSNNVIMKNHITGSMHHGISLEDTSNSNNITKNKIFSNKGHGIVLDDSNSNIITRNEISNNRDGTGLTFYQSNNNNITSNAIANNERGILLTLSDNNRILKNNFQRNRRRSYFKYGDNIWDSNYWNRRRIFPKLIFGTKGDPFDIYTPSFPWFEVDRNPAQEPYYIEV